MANPKYPIPRPGSPISETGSVATREWYNYWQNLTSDSGGPSTAELENDITIISEKLGSPDGTPENIPPQSDGGKIIGINSIAAIGALPGVVTLALQGDVTSPGNTYYYGTNGAGSKSFYTVASAFLGTAGNIALTVGSDGVTTVNLAAVTQGTAGTIRAITLDGFGRVVQNKAATITGTANRVTVTNGDASAGLPTIDIASTYVGQTSITTLGTVTTGTWNATLIGPTFGGTGQNSVTTGDLLYGSATNVWSRLPDVATGNVLRSGGVGVAPAWGKVNLTTDVTGALPIANGGTGQVTAQAAFDALAPTTTNGDVIIRAGGTNTRLGVGTTGQYLGVTAGLPSYRTILASEVNVDRIAGSTYSTLQQFINTMHSPGTIDGPTPVIVDLGSGNIRVLAGKGMIRIADDDVSSLPFFDWSQTDFTQAADGFTRFYGVTYNSGSPLVVQRTTYNWDFDTEIPLGSAVRFASGATVVTPNPYKTGDPITNIIQRFDAQSPAVRDASVGGLIIGNTGTRTATLTAGKVWSRLSDFSVAAKNSSTAPLWSAYFNGTNLTVTTGLTQWDNSQYNTGGALVPVPNNKYSDIYFFLSIDGTTWGFAYGQNFYNTIGDATADTIPTYLTQNFFDQALLLGRIIFQQGNNTPISVDSAFTRVFNTAAITDHNNLSGIQDAPNPVTNEHYHLSSAQSTDVSAINALSTGILAKTGTGTYAARTATAGTGITVTNGSGVAGNPIVAITNTAVTAASYGDATHVATFTVNAQGQLTAAASTPVTFPVTSVFSRTGAVVATSGDYSFSLISGTAVATQGGTGQTTYTLGDTLYSSATNTLAKLAGNITTSKQYLSQTGTGTVSAAPVWTSIAGADITGAALTKTDDTNVTLTLGGTPATSLLRAASITVGWTGTLSIARGGTGQATASAAFDALAPTTTSQDLIVRGASSNGRLGVGSNGNVLTVTGGVVGWAAPATNGTVTSVALSLPSFITVTGGPVTTSGTLTGTLATQTANAVFAGPASGPASAPSFRALSASDLPPIYGYKNKIINANFDVWQRGTSSSSSGFLADMWQVTRIGSTAAVSQQSFALGQTAVPYEPTYFHRSVVTSVAGSGNAVNQAQRIEGVRTFAGQTATLSFWAKADASKNIAVELYQDFGTGGSPSSLVTGLGVTTCALTTAWQKFTVTLTLPSISGKTLGTNGNDALAVGFWFDAGSTFNSRTNSLGQQSGTFDISQVQFEPGSVATSFDLRPIGLERSLCNRYCLVIFPNSLFGLFGFGMWGSTTQVNIGIPTPDPMRTTPSISKIGNMTVLSTGGGFTTVSSIGGAGYTSAQIAVTITMSSTGTTGNSAQLTCNNDATAMLILDAAV